MNSKTTNPPKIPATATTAAMASNTAAITSTLTNTATRPLTTATASAASPQLQSRSHPPLSHTHPYQIQQQQQLPYAATQIRNTQNPNQTQQVPNSSTTSHGVIYPVASSGRGFISSSNRPPLRQEHAVTVANHGGYPLLPVGYPRSHPMVAVSPPFDGALNLHHVVRHPTSHLQQQHQYRQHVGNAAVGGGGVIKGVPVSGQQKVAPSPSPASESNGHKSRRDRSRDDTTIIRDRKVKISDGASLYALCRSWLRNGVPEESQQYGDSLRSLPRPLPIPPAEAHRPTGNDGNEEVEEDAVDEESADHLSTDDLLKRHIKRAKKVRSRLREERLKRIARYKTRLALLLPPLMEQFRNDTNPGN